MSSQEQLYQLLREAIETATGRKMRSPRDFEFLAESVFEKTRQSVSVSTLKRFWGYLPRYETTRVSTLDLLSRFLDYRDWEHFCTEHGGADADTAADDRRVKPAYWTAAALLLLLAVAGALFWAASRSGSDSRTVAEGSYVLRRGQLFDSYADYLRLFGITSTERYWDQPLPHHEGIVVWGPEYHHPQWHNDGERDSLMPTITEWWSPADSIADPQQNLLAAAKNANLYFTVERTNELRITFMKNLTDTGYVFLGVYRIDRQQSDSTHLVWERVADNCDLSNLDYLQELRH